MATPDLVSIPDWTQLSIGSSAIQSMPLALEADYVARVDIIRRQSSMDQRPQVRNRLVDNGIWLRLDNSVGDNLASSFHA